LWQLPHAYLSVVATCVFVKMLSASRGLCTVRPKMTPTQGEMNSGTGA